MRKALAERKKLGICSRHSNLIILEQGRVGAGLLHSMEAARRNW